MNPRSPRSIICEGLCIIPALSVVNATLRHEYSISPQSQKTAVVAGLVMHTWMGRFLPCSFSLFSCQCSLHLPNKWFIFESLAQLLLLGNPELRPEVRKLKKNCQSNGCYKTSCHNKQYNLISTEEFGRQWTRMSELSHPKGTGASMWRH